MQLRPEQQGGDLAFPEPVGYVDLMPELPAGRNLGAVASISRQHGTGIAW